MLLNLDCCKSTHTLNSELNYMLMEKSLDL